MQSEQASTQESCYFIKWNKQPRTLLKAPSYVQAIVRCSDQLNNVFLTIVCRNGEILMQSAQNFSKTEWTGIVKPPVTMPEMPVERFQIEYAVFDATSDSFFFVLHSPGDKEVYWAGNKSLASDAKSSEKAGVRLQTLISTRQNNNRSFCGITVDKDRHILYTCNYECGKIDLWCLTMAVDESPKANLIGSINCREIPKMEPWYCAVFLLPTPNGSTEENEKLLLTVSDWESSSVFLYANSNKKTPPFTAEQATEEGDVGFRYVGIIASATNDEDKEMGTVTFPHEMCFDQFGNLLVADAINDRLQMFKLGDDCQFQSLWTSESSFYHDRSIVVRDPDTKQLIALANNFEAVVCYE